MTTNRWGSRRAAALAAALVATWSAGAAQAALGYDETLRLAAEQAPALAAQQRAVDGARAEAASAATLPDPRVTLGLDNLPVSGADRFRLTADFMTMQRLGLMQEVPNRAKRDARSAGATARVERERAMQAAVGLNVRREAALAWLAVYFAEARLAPLAELERENRLLLETLEARIANGRAMPAERTMARQEAVALADRRDDLQRDVAKARASLRRWIGVRADEPLAGAPPTVPLRPDEVRAGLHRHAEILPFVAQQAAARAAIAEADAEQRGDWGWEVVYSRRGAQFGDMVSFQVSIDLPWQKARRQQPMLAARQQELARIDAERDELMRRHAEEIDQQLAELQALDRQQARLAEAALPLAAERVALALAAYEAGRGDLAAVLAARREAVELRLRRSELEAQRAALGIRLTTLIAE